MVSSFSNSILKVILDHRSNIVLFPLEDPIHIPSVFKGLITKPDNFLKSSSIYLKRIGAELTSESTTVVSSAY